jgi:hypothetical protein
LILIFFLETWMLNLKRYHNNKSFWFLNFIFICCTNYFEQDCHSIKTFETFLDCATIPFKEFFSIHY